MGSWVIGHSLAGYMPESGTSAYAKFDQALQALGDRMCEYADDDDEATLAALDPRDYPDFADNGYSDDYPSMRAHVDAIMTDDWPSEPGDWYAPVVDGRGHVIVFWVRVDDSRDPDTVDE